MSALSSRSKTASARSAPDAVGRGVTGHDPGGQPVLFVLAGNSLGLTPVGVEGSPQWMDLRHLVSLDAVGDPVGSKLPIEASFDGGPAIVAMWPEPFCDQVIVRLRELLDSGQMFPTGAADPSGAPGSPAVAEKRPDSGPIEARGAESAVIPAAASPFAPESTPPASAGPAAAPFIPATAPVAPPSPVDPAPAAAQMVPPTASPAPQPTAPAAGAFTESAPDPQLSAQPQPMDPAQPAPPLQGQAPAPAQPASATPLAQAQAPAPAPGQAPLQAPAPPGVAIQPPPPGQPQAAAAVDAPLWASADDRPLPGDGPRLLGADGSASGSELTLEDVVYHGGYPGQTKKRKKCVAVLDSSGVTVNGPSGPDFRLGWDVVRSVEAQNSDEAKFRLGVKVKRNSTVVVFDCEQGVTIVIEARDVSTMPLKGALHELLDGGAVSVA